MSLELYFTNPGPKKIAVQQSKDQAVVDFEKAMDEAKPLENTRNTSSILTALTRIMADYGAAYQRRPKTILILTDGIWEGTNDSDVDTLISAFISLYATRPVNGHDRHSYTSDVPAKTRDLTFEFIRFGDDQVAIERLRRLDDDLKSRGLP